MQKENEVRKILQAPRHVVQRENQDFSIWRALGWPIGLELLLSHGYLEDSDYPGILKAALHCGYTAAIDILLQSPRFEHMMWPTAVASGNIELMRIVASKLYSKFCDAGAAGLRVAAEPATLTAEYCAQLYLPRQDESLGNFNMTAIAAWTLYETEFRYHDANDATMGTPLWYHAATSTLPLREYLNLMTWLVWHGANMATAHPLWGTMPLHHIAGTISFLSLELLKTSTITSAQHFSHLSEDMKQEGYLLHSYDSTDDLDEVLGSELVHGTFESDETDDCRCLCTLSGCTAVSSALKATMHHSEIEPMSILERLSTSWTILQSIVPPEILKQKSVCDLIIRVSTFEALQLSHTCHNHRLDPNSMDRITDSEIDDVVYAEQSDIRTFEALVEDFLRMWCDFKGTIMEFMQGPWISFITTFLEERNKLNFSEGIQEMEDIGVRLGFCEPPGTEVSEPSYDLAWFKDKIDGILNSSGSNR